MSGDSDSNTRPSNGKPQKAGLKAKKRGVAVRAPANDWSRQAADGYQAAGEPVGEEPPPPYSRLAPVRDETGPGLPPDAPAESGEPPTAATALVRADRERRSAAELKTGNMNGFDLWAYILDSRHRTINLVLILLALAVCIAAAAFDSHSNPVFTISLTSATTVATALGISAVRKRKKRRRG